MHSALPQPSLFLLAFLASPAHAAYDVAFYSHEMQASGNGERIVEFPHAFITLRGRPDAGGRALDGNWGFTADSISPAILAGPVKGRIAKAGKAYIRGSRRHIAFAMSDAQFGSVQRAYKSWLAVTGASYSLETRNCVHFIAAMARAAGLAVPNDASLMKKPTAYLEAVAAQNPQVRVPG